MKRLHTLGKNFHKLIAKYNIFLVEEPVENDSVKETPG